MTTDVNRSLPCNKAVSRAGGTNGQRPGAADDTQGFGGEHGQGGGQGQGQGGRQGRATGNPHRTPLVGLPGLLPGVSDGTANTITFPER